MILKAVTIGIGATVAAAFVIPAAVGAVGFGTGGIATGSAAAKMMAVGGGVTPAAVSVMQSVGATGAISGATKVAVRAFAGATAMATQKDSK